MIARDLVFYRPETVQDAVDAWRAARDAEKKPQYYAGGTEIATLAREGKQNTTDLVDTKHIPETRVMEGVDAADGHELVLGASLTLNMVIDGCGSPLLAACARGIADRTVRNSITLGGNICGMLPYREAVLPFLLLDGEVELAGTEGVRRVPIREVFRKKLQQRDDEFVVRFVLGRELLQGIGAIRHPATTAHAGAYGAIRLAGSGPRGGWFYYRRTTESRLDYPLTTVTMARTDGELRLAISGTWGYPHRVSEAETLFADGALSGSYRDRAVAMVDAVDLKIKQDMRATRDYRRELTIQAIELGLIQLFDHPEQPSQTEQPSQEDTP